MISIYKISTVEPPMVYIGQTKNLQRRIRTHKKIQSKCSSRVIFQSGLDYQIQILHSEIGDK